MKILIFGTFDHLHPGHRFVFEKAMERGDVNAVVARDANVERIKGRKPDQSEQERLRILQTEYPTIHFVFGDPVDFLVPVRTIKPDLILLGYDQQLPPGVREEHLGCSVERLPSFRPEEFKSSLRRGGK